MNRSARVLFVLMCSGALLAPGAPVGAGGGGGCYSAVRDVRGRAVEIKNFCFTPAITRIKRGQTVTWTQRDSAPHAVTGANFVWGGRRELKKGDSISYRFKKRGVFPYYCPYHAGMIGAVVVGDGRRRPVLRRGDDAVVPATSLAQASAFAPRREDGDSRPWFVGVGAAAAGSGALLLRRRRERRRSGRVGA